MQASIIEIGQEKTPVLILDNFFPDPQQLVEQACTEPGFAAQASDYYPGLRKLAPADYAPWALAQLNQLIRSTYSLSETFSISPQLSAYSLATTPVHQLKPIQCIPHVDTQSPHQFALVHYLCDPRYGGTAFYRHRATGFEIINQARAPIYFNQLKQQLSEKGLSFSGYIRGDTDLFEQTHKIPTAFNRAILYPSNLLHSGLIDENLGLSRDPRQGRLTLNTFICFV